MTIFHFCGVLFLWWSLDVFVPVEWVFWDALNIHICPLTVWIDPPTTRWQQTSHHHKGELGLWCNVSPHY